MANSDDEVPIYRFPFEIFDSIFGLLVAEDRYQLETEKLRRVPVSFTISQVSQRWRDIALELPFIWTDIQIFHFQDFQRDMVKALLARTKGLPLSITLEYNKPLTAAQSKNCWNILLDIMSCASRWKALRIAVNEDLFTQICGNFGGREVPLLQRLELVILGFDKRHGHRPQLNDFIVSPLYLELSHTHLLRHLVLSGIRLRMPSPTYMEQLEVLSVDFTPGMDMLNRPGLSEEDPPLQTCLRDLSLTGLVFRNLPTRSYLSEYTAFLTTLSLSNMAGYQASDVTRLFKHLPTVTLRELLLSTVDFSFWNGFMHSLEGPEPRYPFVQRLYLQNISDDYASMSELPPRQFIQGFPRLETLELYHAPSVTNALRFQAMFPCMHTLKVRGVGEMKSISYRELCDVVDFRIENNIPVTALEVDTPSTYIDLPSLSWLQKRVPVFKRHPTTHKLK
ncbi:hypothetical protein FB446DRAFT_525409 [Lentinula raphanica]|nr:hypothetical protein FB446DRAFT_525409 [Lentinula raphanica]